MTIDPMRATGVGVLVDRAYRESGKYQWVRETFINGVEAGASRIDFTVEWSGVASRGVYRRLIADDGCGMTPEQLEQFINVFGGSGKPIGGEHENYGIGSKTSLLPWSKAGVAIVSWHDGTPAMVRLRWDAASEEYGLHVFTATEDDGTEMNATVIEPFDDTDGETGVDWTAVTPDWIRSKGHGTVLVLLGNSLTDDTVLGAPGRNEDATKGVLQYLNSRFWTMPADVAVYADVFSSTSKSQWPTAADSAPDKLNHRRVHGAKHYVEWTTRGAVEASGTETLWDNVDAHWWLRDEEVLSLDYAPDQGFIGVLYKNELYDVSAHAATFRSFGVVNGKIRRRLYVVIEPELADSRSGVEGVYPNSSRSGLLVRDASGERAGERVPIGEWGERFADAMPAAVRAAIAAAMTASGDTGAVDETMRKKIAARFASRWKVQRLKANAGGTSTVAPTAPGTTPRKKPVRVRRPGSCMPGGTGGLGGKPDIGASAGPHAAKPVNVKGDLPSWQPGTADDVGDPWALATFAAHGGGQGNAVIIINAEHPVMRAQIEHYQQQFAPRFAEQIADEVVDAYGLIAATKVAHAESMLAVASPQQVAEMRSNAALTAALLGLYAEDKVLTPRLTGKFGRARRAA